MRQPLVIVFGVILRNEKQVVYHFGGSKFSRLYFSTSYPFSPDRSLIKVKCMDRSLKRIWDPSQLTFDIIYKYHFFPLLLIKHIKNIYIYTKLNRVLVAVCFVKQWFVMILTIVTVILTCYKKSKVSVIIV